MQLKGREAAAFLRKPDPAAAGLLICGEDPVRIAHARAQVLAAITGPQGEAEMRLTRLPAADLRKDPASLSDAMRATGFFPGPRAVWVEEATDGLADTVGAALGDWRPGDAQVIVTAGNLTPRSALRKLFEGARNAFAITLYDDPPGPEEIEALLKTAGLTRVSPEARRDLTDLARALEPGDFRQTIEKLGLYKYDDPSEVTPADIAACAPGTQDAEMDALCDAVLMRDEVRIADLLRRLMAQGSGPVAVVIALGRHLRQLHQIASDPEGGRFIRGGFRRREAMQRQARDWGAQALGAALGQVVETDLQLRSAGVTAPERALVERLLVRLARSGRRQAK